MLRRWIEKTGRGRRFRPVAMAIVAVALTTASFGCSTCEINCPTPVTHAMAFGATNVGCPGGAWDCVCPVPDELDVTWGDHILFVNTSQYDITIKATGGSLYPMDEFVVPAGGEVLVTVKDNPPDDDMDLGVTVTGGQGCPGAASPRLVIHPPATGSS